jgi:hypothetical protein
MERDQALRAADRALLGQVMEWVESRQEAVLIRTRRPTDPASAGTSQLQ